MAKTYKYKDCILTLQKKEDLRSTKSYREITLTLSKIFGYQCFTIEYKKVLQINQNVFRKKKKIDQPLDKSCQADY